MECMPPRAKDIDFQARTITVRSGVRPTPPRLLVLLCAGILIIYDLLRDMSKTFDSFPDLEQHNEDSA